MASEGVGLVLAGGGARGAYEIGALSALLPRLEERGERPGVLVGTSVGALNTAYLAATAERPVAEALADGARIWRETSFRDVLRPLVTPRSFGRALKLAVQLAGLSRTKLYSIVDPEPLAATLERLIPFERIVANVEGGHIQAAAVVATSALSSRTVVFHHGGGSPVADDARGIDYVAAPLERDHVRASAAIPGVFPAVHLPAPDHARGWYFDGGTRLNTPIKPALALGAGRIIVIALNSIAPGPPELASDERPDYLAGMTQFLQAVLVDPLVNDVRTLAGVNEMLREGGERAGGRELVPYMFIAPAEREAVGEIAMRVYNEHYARFRDRFREPDLSLLGRLVDGGSDPLHGELLSYLFFSPELAEELLELGRRDAERWLAQTHEDGPWELGPLG